MTLPHQPQDQHYGNHAPQGYGYAPTQSQATAGNAAQYPQHSQPPHYAPHSPAARARFNVMGAVALAVTAVYALTAFVMPFMYRAVADSGNYSLVGLVTGVMNWGFILIIVGCAVAGVLMKHAQRGRWMAIAALGASGYAATVNIGALAGNWMAYSAPL